MDLFSTDSGAYFGSGQLLNVLYPRSFSLNQPHVSLSLFFE